VELLLEKGAKVDGSSSCSTLSLACRSGHIAVAMMLIENGAKIEGRRDGGHRAKVGPYRRSALHASCEGGYPGVAKLLMESGARVNYVDKVCMAPIHMACIPYPGRNEVNTNPPSHASSIGLGYPPVAKVGVEVSAYRGALVALLMVEGADVNTMNRDERTPLSLACRYGLVDAVEAMISHVANINKRMGDRRKKRPTCCV
jgi:ankyrin repeat protein